MIVLPAHIQRKQREGGVEAVLCARQRKPSTSTSPSLAYCRNQIAWAQEDLVQPTTNYMVAKIVDFIYGGIVSVCIILVILGVCMLICLWCFKASYTTNQYKVIVPHWTRRVTTQGRRRGEARCPSSSSLKAIHVKKLYNK